MDEKGTVIAPLTPAVLHILLAVSTGDRHDYGIMKQVEAIGRMIEAGLIPETDKKMDPAMDDERRVYYQISGLGEKALAAELERYHRVMAVAKQKRLAPNFAYGK